MKKQHVPRIYRCPRGCGAYITPDEYDPGQKCCKYCPGYREPDIRPTKLSKRTQELQNLYISGKINNLRFYTQYDLIVNNVVVGHYVDEFNYDDAEDGVHVVEDCKSAETRKSRQYKQQRKLMRELYNIEIVEL